MLSGFFINLISSHLLLKTLGFLTSTQPTIHPQNQMSSIQLFNFTWQYQPDEEGEQSPANALEIGDPDEVPPLDINIKNILPLPDKKITLNPIAGVTTASTTNYHFKLAFDPGILNTPEGIGIEGDNWSIYYHSDANEDALYLLWKGDAITISHGQLLPKEKEITLTGVAAKRASNESQFIDLEATTTVVTISWPKPGDDTGDNIEVVAVHAPEFKHHSTSPYKTSRKLTLNMVKTTGKSNIPLFVGFVGSNKVLNVNDGTSNLKLRITNTNFTAGDSSNITFHYDSNPAKCSQLVVILEVGSTTDVPWALGTEDQVNGISVSIEGSQWQRKINGEEVKVGGKVKALKWLFEPKSADVVLQPQETILIDLTTITTSHPTGEANLYLAYNYVPGYKDGQFICQIEKAPLVYPEKNVGVGTTTPSEALDVDGNVLVNRSGYAETHYKSGDQSWEVGTVSDTRGFYIYNDKYRLVVDPDGKVGIGIDSPSEKLEVEGTTKTTNLNASGKVGIGVDSPSEKLEVEGTTKTTNLNASGKVGIGIDSPSEKLEVDGNIKCSGINIKSDSSLTIDGKPVMQYKVYEHYLDKNTFVFDTNFSSNDWYILIAGFVINTVEPSKGEPPSFSSAFASVDDWTSKWQIICSVLGDTGSGHTLFIKTLMIRKEFF